MDPYFRVTQEIRRPVAEVFSTVIHLDRFPEWSPRNPWARKITAGEIGEGTRFQIAIKGFGKVTNELREFEPNRQVMVAPLSWMLEGGHRWIFTDLGNGATRIDHELELRAKGAFKLLAPMMKATGRRNVRETAEALERHLSVERRGGGAGSSSTPGDPDHARGSNSGTSSERSGPRF